MHPKAFFPIPRALKWIINQLLRHNWCLWTTPHPVPAYLVCPLGTSRMHCNLILFKQKLVPVGVFYNLS
uniref:Uncharacterized protein n=1 Tax=Rhizophora mucronata TaxID=61149 RepID=A0A2P2NL80_RHIMU